MAILQRDEGMVIVVKASSGDGCIGIYQIFNVGFYWFFRSVYVQSEEKRLNLKIKKKKKFA